MRISITGMADKRAIVYPLLYVLNLLGRTALVTDDTLFLRLSPFANRIEEIGNVTLIVCDDVGGVDVSEYEHVIYANFKDCGMSCDLAIFAQQDYSPLHEVGEIVTDANTKIVRIGYIPPKEKGEIFIPLGEALLREIHKVENLCRFMPFKNSNLNATLAALFAPSFGQDTKAMKKLLCYKGGEIT